MENDDENDELTLLDLSLCPRARLPFCALFSFRERFHCSSANDAHSIRRSMWFSRRWHAFVATIENRALWSVNGRLGHRSVLLERSVNYRYRCQLKPVAKKSTSKWEIGWSAVRERERERENTYVDIWNWENSFAVCDASFEPIFIHASRQHNQFTLVQWQFDGRLCMEIEFGACLTLWRLSGRQSNTIS